MFKSLSPSTLLSPVPAVMISCKDVQDDAVPNIITIAWAGTVCSKPPMVSVSIKKQRFSHDIIKRSGEFAINLVSSQLSESCDFCGVKSGRDVDKFKACSLTPVKVDGLRCAVGIEQSPLILGCKTERIIELGSHDMFLARVVSVMAREELFDKKGKLCMDRANLISYAHGEYFETGKKLGFFGWSVASKKAMKRRR